jgi:exopolysaccharide production protein ExoY
VTSDPPSNITTISRTAATTAVPTPVSIHARTIDDRPANAPAPLGRWYHLAKRAIDVFVVVGLAPIWVPAYGVASLAIVVLDGRPIHYRDRRVGMGGRDLELLKFRTMRVNARHDLEAMLERDPEMEAEFRRFAKLRSDPRLTPMGRIMRRLSLDELPQLLHVLQGTMSLVGPRPLTGLEIEEFYGDAAGELLSVPPGLTGLWQISGRSLLSFDRRVPLDLAYVRNRSLSLDLKILVRTLPKVVSGHGAV